MNNEIPRASAYALLLGITEPDAYTAKNIHLSVADCKHLAHILNVVHCELDLHEHMETWNTQLENYLKTAK